MKRILYFTFLLLLITACNAPAAPATQPAADEPTLAPYPGDTPAPPEINAPIVDAPALFSMQFINTLDGWGVTATQIVRTNDGGVTWYNVTPAGIAETGYSVQLRTLDSSHAWVHLPDPANYPYGGFVHRTADGGLTWTMNSVPFSSGDIQMLNANDGWALADLGGGAGSNAIAVFQTTDGGASWVQTYINDPNNASASDSLPLGGIKFGIAPVSMNTAWVYGVVYAPGTVYLYRTDDSGANWSEVKLPLPVGAENVELSIDDGQMKFASPNQGYAVLRLTGDMYQAAVYTSQDGGATWELTLTPIPDGGSADFLSAQDMVIYNGDQFYVTNDAARTWRIIPPDVIFGETFAMMDFVNLNTGWVITLDSSDQRTLYRTSDGGATWSPLVP